MPGPVPIDGFDKINFIVSVWWQKCTPSPTLMVKFAREPALDVFLVAITPDWEDMIETWLRPGTERHRKPARHGRKRNYADILLDPGTAVNESVRQQSRGIYQGIKLPGAKAMFRINDTIDRVNWSTFVLEGITEIGFVGMLGAINAQETDCDNLAYVSRHDDEWGTRGGAGDLLNPQYYPILDGANGFASAGIFGYGTFEGPWMMAHGRQVTVVGGGGVKGLSFNIRESVTTNILHQSGAVDLADGESAVLSCSGSMESGQFAYPGHDYLSGHFQVGPGQILCWGNPKWT